MVRRGMAGKGNIIVGQSLIRCGLWVRAWLYQAELWASAARNYFLFGKRPFSFRSAQLYEGLQCLRLQFSNLTSRGEQNCLWVNQFKHKQAQTIHTKYVWILPHASVPLNHVRSHVLRPQTWLGFHSDNSLRDFTVSVVFCETRTAAFLRYTANGRWAFVVLVRKQTPLARPSSKHPPP